MRSIYKGAIGGIAAALLFFVGFTTVEGQDENSFNQVQTPEFVSTHGSVCQPANLGQATRFNATWTLQGITNPNPLGSGGAFFVVCPVPIIDDGSAQPGADLWVHALVLDNNAADITCTSVWRRSNGTSIKAVSGSYPASADSGGFPIEDVISDFDFEFTGTFQSLVAVCRLPPQTGIGAVVFDSD